MPLLRPLAPLAVLASALTLAPGAPAASGLVVSGRHDGGAFRYAIAVPGWTRVAGAGGEYAFRLARDGVMVTVSRSDEAGSAHDLAGFWAARAAGRRAVDVDAHHAEVVAADGRVLMAFADTTGPFRTAFWARAGRDGAPVLHALAHGARFAWAGPDVRHLRSDRPASAVVAASNAAMLFEDSYRDSVTLHGRAVYEIERVRSKRYENAVFHDRGGDDHQLFVGGVDYERTDPTVCWTRGPNRPGDDAFAPITVLPAGPFVALGPVRTVGGVLRVVETSWDVNASSLRTVLSFEPSTHLLLRRSSSLGDEVFAWIPITVQPKPSVLCGTSPGHPSSSAGRAAPVQACSSLEPRSLQLEIGSAPGTRAVRWNPSLHAIVVRDTLGGNARAPRLEHPSCRQWQAFWRALDRAEVWRWHREYVNRDVYDGWWWSVQIARGETAIDSHGGDAEPSSFETFRQAVTALIAPIRFTTPPPM